VVIAVFDTNILIDYLNGEVKAKNTIEQYDQIAISVITYIEIMVGVKDVHKKNVEYFKKNQQDIVIPYKLEN
jgi:predicted nucleic acid-binding protein